MPRPVAVLAALALLSSVAACSGYPGLTLNQGGDGALTSESRATGEFRRIRIGEGFRLDARTGTGPSVSVSAPADLLPLIDTSVKDGELVVSLTSLSIGSHDPMTVTVVAPELDAVRLDTGASGTLAITAPALELDVTSGASVTGQGTIPFLDLNADLGGSAELAGVRVDVATVSIGAGGSATLAPDTSVTGTVGTGGKLVLASRPREVRVDVRLGGTLIDG